MLSKKPATLLMSNGEIFKGFAFGKIGYTIGEVCFNTGMTGYQEILTDPSYSGQLITMTYPHIGNYGINLKDVESRKIQASGLIIKDGNMLYSNYRAQDSLENYLKNSNIVAIQGLDTRKLVRILTTEGAMNGIISSKQMSVEKMQSLLQKHPSMGGKDLAKVVTCKKPYYINKDKFKKKVVVIDYGIKSNILNLLANQKLQLIVLPAKSTTNQIMKYNPNGIFLSNGPGDPSAVTYAIESVKELLKLKIPIFGICLGHQILALALGAKTFKLKFGHRGCNHPVKNINLGNVEITSQNHGFAVESETIPENVEITHYSLNDNTVEGISCNDRPAFSVQYHPESSPGPHDSRYLFEKFMQLIDDFKKKTTYAKTK